MPSTLYSGSWLSGCISGFGLSGVPILVGSNTNAWNIGCIFQVSSSYNLYVIGPFCSNTVKGPALV